MDIRTACEDDLDELIAVLDRAFSWPRQPCLDFRRMRPHLLHPGRASDHLIGIEQGRIVALVGIYDHAITIDGVELHGAAIGQVATLPEVRGQGRMRTMLDAAIELLDARNVELSWLDGDRRRYGKHGWAIGGTSVQYTLVAHQLPQPPDPSHVVRMNPELLIETLIGHGRRLRNHLHLSPFELEQLARVGAWGGVRLGESWLIHGPRGDRVFFGEGEFDELGCLFAHLITHTPFRPDQLPMIVVEGADEPTTLDRACRRFHRSVVRRPSCLWRVGKLAPFLTRAVEMAAPRIGPGRDDALALVDTAAGESATLECRDGRLMVHGGIAAARSFEASTLALSDLCFGAGSIDHALPELPPDSPLRQVLPIRAHLGALFPY